MFVRTRMTANPFTTTPETPIPDALEQMESQHVRHLPVLSDGKLVGVVSRGDIMAATPSKATTFSAGELLYLLAKLTVRKVMTTKPITVAPDTLLEQAALLMRDNRIEMLPVLDGDKVVGVITESNILDSFIDILGFRDPGTRLWIEAVDEPGVLARLTAITGRYRANITHLAVYRGNSTTSTIVLGLNTLNTDEIETEMAADGFEILSKVRND